MYELILRDELGLTARNPRMTCALVFAFLPFWSLACTKVMSTSAYLAT